MRRGCNTQDTRESEKRSVVNKWHGATIKKSNKIKCTPYYINIYRTLLILLESKINTKLGYAIAVSIGENKVKKNQIDFINTYCTVRHIYVGLCCCNVFSTEFIKYVHFIVARVPFLFMRVSTEIGSLVYIFWITVEHKHNIDKPFQWRHRRDRWTLFISKASFYLNFNAIEFWP